MSQYRNASEAEALANGVVIPTWKPFLRNWRIAYVLNSGSMKSGGIDVWAKIKKCSPLEKFRTDDDLLVVINAEIWAKLTSDQRTALLHHEFCHVGENDEGELVMLPHDLEEFGEVVKAHGLWRPAVEHFASQLTLRLNDGVDKPQPSFDPHGTGTPSVEDEPLPEMGGDEVSTVTLEANGKSVTMTGEEFDRATAALVDSVKEDVDLTTPEDGDEAEGSNLEVVN